VSQIIGRYLSYKKKSAWLAGGAFALWGLTVATGMRLPFIYTQFTFQSRAFIVFPLLLAICIYCAFIYRNGNQPSGYKQAMNRLPDRKSKLKETAWGVAGFLLLTGGFAWTSVSFPAWAANLLATTAFERTYQINDITTRSGPVWRTLFELKLSDTKTGEEVELPLTRRRYETHHWKIGESICVKGRTSIFGAIADGETRDVESCYLNNGH
jgi:hypothetical protein